MLLTPVFSTTERPHLDASATAWPLRVTPGTCRHAPRAMRGLQVFLCRACLQGMAIRLRNKEIQSFFQPPDCRRAAAG